MGDTRGYSGKQRGYLEDKVGISEDTVVTVRLRGYKGHAVREQ